MRLTKKLEKEVINAYEAYFDNYIKGNVEAITFMLDEEYNQIGSAESEVFFNKKDAVKFLYDTIDQVAGKTEIRNRILKVEPVENLILVTDLFDIYALIESDWSFYSKFRASTLMQKKKDGWKFIHQHSSMPDTRTNGGENIAIEKIAEENQQLREGIKRRTIELENKNRELEIETSLEKVRAIALSMKEPSDMLDVCKTISLQLQSLGVEEIRNVQTAIFYEQRGTYMNYEYYTKQKKTLITETIFTNNKTHKAFAAKMLKGKGEIFITHIKGKKVKDWIAYQKTTNVFIDKYLETASSLNYYWFSLGPVALGISTYSPLSEDDLQIFNHFRNVFELAYRRFIDIEIAIAQAREAQIETALEKIRNQTLLMKDSSELNDAVAVFFQQFKVLELLPAEARTYFSHVNTTTDTVEVWMTHSDGSVMPTSHITPLNESPPLKKYYKEWKKNKEVINIRVYKGKTLKDYMEFLSTLPHVVKDKDYKKLFKSPPKQIVMTDSGFLQGFLGIMSYVQLKQETLDLLVRFTKVFEFTYTRFLDLQKAEAQAREAQIEAALERVRSRSMAMHSSDEFVDASDVMFDQLKKLGIETLRIGIGIMNTENNTVEIWSRSEIKGKAINTILGVVPSGLHPIFDNMVKAWKENKPFFSSKRVGDEVKEYYEKLASSLSYPKRKVYNERESITTFFFAQGSLNVISLEPLNKEECNIMIRFAGVFGQIYQRFLDLQKAEAQAREAQIEAALERVRSRTMGMQKSEELKEVIQAVYEQFVRLNIHIEHTGFIMDYKARDDMHIWLADRHEIPSEVTFPYFDCAHWNSFNEAKEKGIDFFANHLTFEEKNRFYQDLFKLIPGVPEETLEYYFSCPGLAISTVLLENVGLYIENFSGIPYSDEENKTLMRFGNVFQQTYTRFLDLQKAEEQVREAQIENALEKVRSQTMGMQSSEDLAKVATVMFDQLRLLGGELFACGIVLCDKNKNEVEQWHSLPGAGMMAPFFVPIDLDHIHQYRYDQWKSGIELFSIEIEEDIIAAHFDRMLALPSVKEVWEGIANKGLPLPEIPTWEIDYGASFQYGYLLISALQPFEEANILPRFAKVFEQTYTRFLDLQKAEAQAREAQIETALERVRARTMGMQRSDELPEAANTLFTQVQDLGMPAWSAGYCIWKDERKAITLWMSSEGVLQPPFEIPTTEDWSFIQFREAYERGETFWVGEIGGEEIIDHYNYLRTMPGVGDSLDEIIESGHALPTFQIMHCAYFSKGFLLFITYEPVPDAHDIFKRFSKVFEQTYTRFLDLQKAEAQAREAQIELSLERIRAQAMAMKESSDLLDIVVTMRSEFVGLGHEAHYFWHMRWLPEIYEKAMTSGDGTRVGMVMDLPRGFHENGAMIEWEKNDEPIAVFAYDAEGAVDYVDRMIRMGDFHEIDHNAPGPDDIRAIGGITFIMARTTHGEIGFSLPGKVTDPPPEDLTTLIRFAGAFDLAYRRFEDLKEAEAQAREAQIEAALEKVRARAMAMQKPGELVEVAQLLRKEMGLLGVEELETSSIYIHSEVSGTTECWYAIQDIREQNKKLVTDHMTIQLNDTWIGREMMKFYNASRQKQTSILMQGENRKEWINYCAEHSELLHGYYGDVIPERTYHLIKFSNGYMGAASPGDISIESWNLLERATSVFSLAYTRFSDLQLAEAQTREAQIELALERVRAKTMAMQKSNELAGTAAHLFEQLNGLGIKPYRCNIAIVDAEYNSCQLWSTTNNGNVIPTASSIPLDEYSVFEEMYDGWRSQQTNHIIKLIGEERVSWTKYISQYAPFDEYKPQNIKKERLLNETAIFSNFYFKQGFFVIHTIEDISESDLKIIQRFANVFEQTYTRFLDLENAELQNKIIQVENERKTQELEEARELQLSMLPKELPQLENYEIAVYMQTATEVGGDYYDFNVDDDGTLTAVVGDATGHGMKAGTIVTITKSLFNSLGSEPNILETFKKVSQVIKNMKFRQLSMCLIMLKINGNQLLLSSAAMPPALIYRKKQKSVEEIVSNGMPLGAMVNFPYKLKEAQIKCGDTIFLMSDGFPELMNEKKGMYGYEKVKSEFLTIAEKSPNEIIDSLKNSASQWVNSKDPDDDVTFVVIKVK